MRTREDKALTLFSDNFCKILANLSPLPSEGSGEASFRDVLLVGLPYHPTTGPSGCSPPSECVFFFSTFLSPFLLSLMDLSYLSYSRR